MYFSVSILELKKESKLELLYFVQSDMTCLETIKNKSLLKCVFNSLTFDLSCNYLVTNTTALDFSLNFVRYNSHFYRRLKLLPLFKITFKKSNSITKSAALTHKRYIIFILEMGDIKNLMSMRSQYAKPRYINIYL